MINTTIYLENNHYNEYKKLIIRISQGILYVKLSRGEFQYNKFNVQFGLKKFKYKQRVNFATKCHSIIENFLFLEIIIK